MKQNNNELNYENFISELKEKKNSGATVREILEMLFLYYKDNVKYNYNHLQLCKLVLNQDINYVIKEINDKIEDVNDRAEKSGKVLTSDDVKNAIKYSKEKVLSIINDYFYKNEGRPFTKENIERCLCNYGKIIKIPKMIRDPASTPSSRPHGKIFICPMIQDGYIDKIGNILLDGYPPKYKNDLLIEGVCANYVVFEEKICKDLNIKHKTVNGIGTTLHTWSLIYLDEEKKWVHFDMTMSKFYLDNWIKNHEPYKPEDWICASTEDIFKMQPTRRITKIGDVDCEINKDSTSKNIDKFLIEDSSRSL